jgi:predicted DNA-binding transcriptional regulator YafY
MRLFLDDEEIARLVSSLGGVKPLYDKEDFRVVDGANDPDPYASLHYRKIFRTLLDARERKKCLQIRYRARSGNKRNVTVEPTALQYSVKDDKFRLLCKGRHGDGRARRIVMNVSRIAAADICDASPPPGPGTEPETKTAVVSLSAERDTPERAMMHFANYECASYAREDGKIEMNIKYNAEDEKEVLVRALAFGPQIRVLAPDSLVNMIKERLTRQMKFFGTN